MAVTTITPQTLTDDSGDNLSGTILTNTIWQQLLTNINALIANAIVFGSTITERARSTPIGEWIAVTYAGGNFTANGGGSWTVDSGDQLTFKYMLVGKTMTISLVLDATSVTGTVTSLIVAVPGGFAAAVKTGTVAIIYDNSSTVPGTGLFQINAAGTTFIVLKGDGTNFTASTNNTFLRVSITFEIQ